MLPPGDERQVSDRRTAEYGYPGGDRSSRFAVGLVSAVMLLGLFWVSLDNLESPAAGPILLLLALPLAELSWIALRGAMGRRVSFSVDDVGLSIVEARGARRTIPWAEIRSLRHVGRTLDPHMRLRVGAGRKVVRIYYRLENAADVLEECVSRAHAAADAYSLPFTARRPGLVRAMRLPLLLAVPCFAVAVAALANGALTPFFLFGMIGGFILVGSSAIRAQQPSEVAVSEAGISVAMAAKSAVSVGWEEITDLQLRLSAKQLAPPVLIIERKGDSPIVLGTSWLDPIRLLGLLKRIRPAAAR